MKFPWNTNSEDDGSDFPNQYGMTDVDIGPDARHVDVAILWGVGMERQAHALAKELRPNRTVVGTPNDGQTYENLKEAVDRCGEN